jgi:predicted dehydrogenase
MAEPHQIGMGIVGSGFMGRTYAECLARYTQGARLVGVAIGRRAPQLAADYSIEHLPTVEALIARDDIDAVIITTPESEGLHLEQTKMAAIAGKHVLVEKPMAPDMTQCNGMIDACRQANVTLMVIQSQRFRGVHQRAHKLIREGRIGAVRQIRHWGLQPLQYALEAVKPRPFYLDPSGGGLFMGYAVHSFDLVRWLAGSEARSLFAHVTRYGDHHIPDLSMMAQGNFENGVSAQVWTCLELPGNTFPRSQFRTQVVGEKGLLDFDGYTHLDLATDRGWERVWEQPPLDPENPADPVRLEAYVDMVQAFIDAIINDHQPPVTGEDGRAAVELCLAARRSSQTGQVVTLPL